MRIRRPPLCGWDIAPAYPGSWTKRGVVVLREDEQCRVYSWTLLDVGQSSSGVSILSMVTISSFRQGGMMRAVPIPDCWHLQRVSGYPNAVEDDEQRPSPPLPSTYSSDLYPLRSSIGARGAYLSR